MAETPANAVQSAAQAMLALQALAACAPAATLSAIAAAAGMPPAKLHRYLQALIATGFATQDAAGGRYALGPAAIALGLAAIGRLDPAEAAAGQLPSLRDATGHTAFFAVWANHGPTIVRVCEPPGAVTVVSRAGSVLPLHSSATGLAFAAFLPPEALAAHPSAARDPMPVKAQLSATLAAIRHQGYATVHGSVLAGIDAAAAPVFAPNAVANGGIAGVLTILGPAGALDVSPHSPAIQALRAAAQAASHALGLTPKTGAAA